MSEDNYTLAPCWGIYVSSGVPYLHQKPNGLGYDLSGRVVSPYKVDVTAEMIKLGCPHQLKFSSLQKPKWVPEIGNRIFWAHIPEWKGERKHLFIDSLSPIALHVTLSKLQLLGSVVRADATYIIEENKIARRIRQEMNLTNITPFTSINYKRDNPHLWWEVATLVMRCKRPMIFVGDPELLSYPHIDRITEEECALMLTEITTWLNDHMSHMNDIKPLQDIGAYLTLNNPHK
jgi:hypothetical protein